MKRHFTQAEVYYLNTLPAVERASMDRITYSREFQVRCMAQYLRGNGPTSIFASAGLNPKIVGSKRIERAIARWKADPQIMTEAQSFANEAAADQRDLLVISQSMTIAWLEKKVMDLQDQLRSMEAHAAECLVRRRTCNTNPFFHRFRTLRHIYAAPRRKKGFFFRFRFPAIHMPAANQRMSDDCRHHQTCVRYAASSERRAAVSAQSSAGRRFRWLSPSPA